MTDVALDRTNSMSQVDNLAKYTYLAFYFSFTYEFLFSFK